MLFICELYDRVIVMLTQMFLLPQGVYLSMRRQKSGFADD